MFRQKGRLRNEVVSLSKIFSNELSHYGVLGMRWGVRRYQNKDGSLTALGMKRYNELYDAQKKASKSNEYQHDLEIKKRAKGIQTISPTVDVIKKGAVLKRICDSSEPIDDRVKYASILDNDSENYIDTAKNDGLAWSKNQIQRDLVLKKDIKVAPSKMVLDYVMENSGDAQLKEYREYFKGMFGKKAAKEMVKRYGNIKIRDIYDQEKGDTVFNALSYNQYALEKVGTTTLDKIIHERVAAGQTIGRKLLRDNVYKNGNKIYEHFKKLGYDAIVDAEDVNEGLFDYPLILLNPKESIKYGKERSF